MYSCKINLAGKYSYLTEKFTAGLKWLSENDIRKFPDGKHEIPESYGRVLLSAGDFIIVSPEEAHMSKCAVNSPEKVRKVVIKVKA